MGVGGGVVTIKVFHLFNQSLSIIQCWLRKLKIYFYIIFYASQ